MFTKSKKSYTMLIDMTKVIYRLKRECYNGYTK